MNMTTRDVPCIDVLQGTWPQFSENLRVTLGVPALLYFVPLLVVGVPACIVGFVAVGATAMANKDAAWVAAIPIAIVAGLAFAVAYNFIRVGWVKIALQVARGESTSFSQVWTAKEWFVNFLICNFLIGIGTAIGTLFLVVPGIFFAIRTCMAPYLVVDQNMGPFEALTKSNEMVTGYSWQILIYMVLYGVANAILGIVPVGALLSFVTMGFFDLGLTKVYLMRKD